MAKKAPSSTSRREVTTLLISQHDVTCISAFFFTREYTYFVVDVDVVVVVTLNEANFYKKLGGFNAKCGARNSFCST
jgi:hypothetical protein